VSGINSGCVFRAINKGGRVYGEGLTANVVWSVVQSYAAAAGVPQLAPHDLRRYAVCRVMPNRISRPGKGGEPKSGSASADSA
jgi:hypothetical protein